MKFNTTMTQLRFFYTFTGVLDGEYCFKLTDAYALALATELPWCEYTVKFPIDPLRPLMLDDTVSIAYIRTNTCSPRLRWKPVSWELV